MALRTGLPPSELIAYPLVFTAIVEELVEQDEAVARSERQARLKEQLR